MTAGLIWVLLVFSPVFYHAGRAASGALARGARSVAPQRSITKVRDSAGVVPAAAGATATS
ncbi:hypothetical protein AWB99_24255 [Mycolicibacterium confluentis]|uniref:Uncharacterized protein n=1 Tax=Mycolicibacterium confluentis TaxID=28047 RepID=A0A7I7XST4_9MYCO|nr:hypothetical protein AWB99_24255 [Mycolicibacterium confluentis]BBZ32002.1 hypothetical protein MCNF_06070 [Mycolicibacterium confluentis]